MPPKDPDPFEDIYAVRNTITATELLSQLPKTGGTNLMANPADLLKRALASDSPTEVHACMVTLLETGNSQAAITLATTLAKKKIQLEERALEMAQKLEQFSKPPLLVSSFVKQIDPDTVELEGCNGSSFNPAFGLQSDIQPGDRVLTSAEGQVVGYVGKPSPVGCSQAVVIEVKPDYAILEAAGESDKVLAHLRGDVPTPSVGDEVLYTKKPNVIVGVFEHEKEQKWLVEKPERVLFSHLGGMDTTLSNIRRDLELHLLHQAEVKQYQIRPLTGITLHGPPGTGKTKTAKAIAYYLAKKHKGSKFLNIAPGSLRGWLYGQTEHRIRELFSAAKDCPGYCVIFFDELDNFGTRSDSMESGIDSRVLATLLSELDGMGSQKEKILVIGATNRLDLCDGALIRPGRFGDRVYEIPRPDRTASQAILKQYLPPKLPYHEIAQPEAVQIVLDTIFDPSYKVLALNTHKDERFEVGAEALTSGALLEAIAQDIKQRAAHRFIQKQGPLGITTSDAKDATCDAVRQEAQKLTKPRAAAHALGEPDGQHITSVELL